MGRLTRRVSGGLVWARSHIRILRDGDGSRPVVERLWQPERDQQHTALIGRGGLDEVVETAACDSGDILFAVLSLIGHGRRHSVVLQGRAPEFLTRLGV